LLEYDTSIENPLRDKMLKVPVRLSESHVELPSGSGLGVEIDWDAIDRFRIF
jgi:L-alanine-DL-glutamate epimerase-like enolase superfamily enzyme